MESVHKVVTVSLHNCFHQRSLTMWSSHRRLSTLPKISSLPSPALARHQNPVGCFLSDCPLRSAYWSPHLRASDRTHNSFARTPTIVYY